MDDIGKGKRSVKVLITYDYEDDEIRVLSEFENPNDTVKLIQLGLETFLNEVEVLNCVKCGSEVHYSWSHCAKCGQEL
jgi:hypothetical protein